MNTSVRIRATPRRYEKPFFEILRLLQNDGCGQGGAAAKALRATPRRPSFAKRHQS